MPFRLITIALPLVGVSVKVPVSTVPVLAVGAKLAVKVLDLSAATVKAPLRLSEKSALGVKLCEPVAVKSAEPEFVTVKVTVSVVYCGTVPASNVHVPLLFVTVPDETAMPPEALMAYVSFPEAPEHPESSAVNAIEATIAAVKSNLPLFFKDTPP